MDSQGYLTKDEKAARKLADKDGKVSNQKVTEAIKQNRRLKQLAYVLIFMSVLMMIGMAFMGVKLSTNIDSSTKSTEIKIEESVTTKVENDENGSPHLIDKVSGQELTVRSEGDSFETVAKVNPFTKKKLNCVSINEVAAMVNDLSKGTPGSVAMKDEDGLSTKIMSISGDFEDHHHYLQFGSFNVVFGDDACNADPVPFSIQRHVPSYDQDSDAQNEDEGMPDGDGDESSIFKRRLRNPTHSKPNKTPPMTRSELLEKHRRHYAMASAAIQAGAVRHGRKLWWFVEDAVSWVSNAVEDVGDAFVSVAEDVAELAGDFVLIAEGAFEEVVEWTEEALDTAVDWMEKEVTNLVNEAVRFIEK